jgi:hypothetical protein
MLCARHGETFKKHKQGNEKQQVAQSRPLVNPGLFTKLKAH